MRARTCPACASQPARSRMLMASRNEDMLKSMLSMRRRRVCCDDLRGDLRVDFSADHKMAPADCEAPAGASARSGRGRAPGGRGVKRWALS
eukprot:1067224-Pyramimonas_sp.AAC.1